MNATILFALRAALFSALCGGPAHAQGYQVQPMLATLAPSGSGASVRMTLKNTGAIPITLELEPFRVSVDQAGIPTRAPEEKDLLVFPPQTILPPGKEQVVQVRYVGDPALTEARAYGVRVNQLPVTFSQGAAASTGAGTDLKMSFSFLSHLFVTPAGASAKIDVTSADKAPDGTVKMSVVNRGNAVLVLNDAVWVVEDGAGHKAEVPNADVSLGDFSALLPGQQRTAIVAAKDAAALQGSLHAAVRLP